MIEQLFLQKIVLSIFVGALIGLEREYTKKQEIVGLRTFSLISLLGALTAMISQELLGDFILVFIGFFFICLFSIGLYISSTTKKKYFGFTTNMAIIICYIIGVFAGLGLFIESIFLSILIATILFSKERLHHIVEHLTEKEVGDLLEFLVLLGIIYPIIPTEVNVYGIVIPLFTIWLLIVMVSLLNFAAFISSRFMSTKHEIETICFLGGLVQGWAAINSLLHVVKKKSMKHLITGGVFIINSANMLRVSLLIIITAPFAGIYLIPSLVVGLSMMLFFGFRRIEKKGKIPKIKISSPFNVVSGIKLAAMALIFFMLFNLVQGISSEFVIVFAFVSSLISSTATIISLVSLLTEGAISTTTMAISSLLIVMGALISNLLILLIYKKAFALRNALKEHVLSLAAIVIAFMITAYFFL